MRRWIGWGVLWVCALALPLQAESSEGVYELAGWSLPQQLQPGERVSLQVSFKVVRPGEPAYRRPVMQLLSAPHGESGQRRVLPLRVTPWQWPDEQAVGQVFQVTSELDLPLDFPVGSGSFALRVARNPAADRWEYAALVDAPGKSLGTRFLSPVEVRMDASKGSGQGDSSMAPQVIPRISTPALSGPLVLEAWEAATRIELVDNQSGEAGSIRTQAWLAHDGSQLLMLTICDEPDMDRIVAQEHLTRDGPIWSNESVQLFIAPRDRQSYVQMIVDVLNQRYDALGGDAYGYNPTWHTDVLRESDRWIVRVAIPFTALTEAAPEPGDAWFVNVARQRWAEPQVYAWQPTFGGLRAPGRFVPLVFDSIRSFLQRELAAVQAIDRESWREPVAGELAQLETRLAALAEAVAGEAEEDLRARYGEMSGRLNEVHEAIASLRSVAMRQSGRHYLAFETFPYERFAGEPLVVDRPAGPVAVQLLRNEWLDLAWNIENPSDRTVTLRVTLRPESARDYDRHVNWELNHFLKFGFEHVHAVVQQAMPVATADGTVVHDVIVPRPDGLIQIAPRSTAQVWLSLQPSSRATGRQTGFVLIQPVDGTAAPAERIDIALEVIPEDLLALPRRLSLFLWNLLPPDVTDHPEWFRAHIDDLIAHGIDTCMISSGRHMPRPKADEAGNLVGELDFSRLDALLDQVQGRFRYYFMTTDIWHQAMLRRDLIGLPIEHPGYEKAFKSWFFQITRHLLDRGITYEQLLVNPHDENIGPRSLQLARWMKEVDPKIQLIQNSSPGWQDDVPPAGLDPEQLLAYQRRQVAAIDGVTDHWMPHYKYFFPENLQWFYEDIRASGKPLWMYYYSEGPNDKSQHPAQHFLSRFWWAYQQQLHGFGWWAMQYYGDPWYRAGHVTNYDTSLVYPTAEGVLPSRRWQAWRQGWQDHQLLSVIRSQMEARDDSAGLAELETLVQQVIANPGNPRVATGARVWLKNQWMRN